MKRSSRPLQSMVEKQIAEIPRLLAISLIRKKLEPFGHAENEALVRALVEKLFDADSNEAFVFDDASATDSSPHNIAIEFNGDDLVQLEKAVTEFTRQLPDIFAQSAKKAADVMLRHYQADWAQARPYIVAEMAQFAENLEARWGKGFDLLRMLIELSRDQGIAFHRRARRSRSTRQMHLKSALIHLHARGIQIASEIMTLMEHGYADGAMARWRTLHEVTCVATVLKDGGNELAERYLAHEVIEAKKAHDQYQQCHSALAYPPISMRESKHIKDGYDAAIVRYGKDFAGDYGWVAGHLGISRPNFSQIEQAAGRAMMRSHYKMASHNVHASVKGIAYRLGTIDKRFGVIAGASNVGFVDPGQNLGLTLLQLTILLLPERWTLDQIALLNALIKLESRIAPALVRSQQNIVRDERRIHKEATAPAKRRASRTKS